SPTAPVRHRRSGRPPRPAPHPPGASPPPSSSRWSHAQTGASTAFPPLAASTHPHHIANLAERQVTSASSPQNPGWESNQSGFPGTRGAETDLPSRPGGGESSEG